MKCDHKNKHMSKVIFGDDFSLVTTMNLSFEIY